MRFAGELPERAVHTEGILRSDIGGTLIYTIPSTRAFQYGDPGGHKKLFEIMTSLYVKDIQKYQRMIRRRVA